MKFKKCKICGKSKINNQQIFLTDDGYCTVCNHEHKDRPRIKPLFEFKTKDIEYPYLSHYNKQRTEKSDMLEKIRKEAPKSNVAVTIYQQWLRNRERRITEWL